MSANGFVADSENKMRWRQIKRTEKFNNFLPLYQRVCTDTIQKKKKQRDLFDSRLQKYIENTKKGIMYCERNDNGR